MITKSKSLLSIGVVLLLVIPATVALTLLRSPYPQSALSEAVWTGDVLRARVAIALGADINRHPGGSLPNLVAAGWRGDVPMIEFLLSRGADIESADKFGGTALSTAAQNGCASAVEYLLTHGANPNVQDKEGGNTPLDLAETNHERIVSALKKAGGKSKADINRDR